MIIFGFDVSDELLVCFVPILVYWVYSGIYGILGSLLESYKLHSTKQEKEMNLVNKLTVVKGVILQQAIQVLFTTLFFTITGGSNASDDWNPSLIVQARQFVMAMAVFDTWCYFVHRYMHHNKFLYKHVHSHHHRLIVPYAFGAIYNHPLEAFLMDIIGGSLAMLLSGMNNRTSIFFFSFATVKNVDDHCGLWLPGNPFHLIFTNNTAYHDIHHQRHGAKYNFGQPFFVTWDKMLGTYMPHSLVKRAGGGFESRAPKNRKE